MIAGAFSTFGMYSSPGSGAAASGSSAAEGKGASSAGAPGLTNRAYFLRSSFASVSSVWRVCSSLARLRDVSS